MIVGAKDNRHIKDAMMWTILGFPLTSVAIPTWISAGDQLFLAVTLDKNFKSPICTAALKFKEECFPITYDNVTNYINHQSAKDSHRIFNKEIYNLKRNPNL